MANIVKGEGVPDFVLLDQLTEDAMYNNIKIRYDKDRIYTYIGEVVVSMNPYKQLDIYKRSDIEEYRGRYMYEKQPHIFALSNNAFRSMMQNKENQCIIISGESGAGKTEASKKIMQFISAVSKSQNEVSRIKDKLLDSNPVLEAFGNAKTLRNDNSSRFGKYMEIQFDHGGAPIGGRINIYLLEKSRVVTRTVGERSFHIFYQMIRGMSESELKAMHLTKDFNSYEYIKNSKCDSVDTINDVLDFKSVKSGMETLGFKEEEKKLIFNLVSAILLIGNITFVDDKANSTVGESKIQVADFSLIEKISELLSVDAYSLKNALVSRQISTGVSRRLSVIHINLDNFQAVFTRDALAKALYSLLFSWLVEKINETIHANVPRSDTLVIGVLDIYGFEIFEKNSFEQFCINFCNEKLQQLFIELTLKTEQEEYVREGIRWTPIEYFNNKIICDLIEARPMGIIPLLDEACLVANSTDSSFLDKLNRAFNKHKHYESWATTNKREIPNEAFRLKHYAGDVTYSVEGFLSKNKDTLFLDLVTTMISSKNPLLPELFKDINTDSKKRPVTAGTQFRTSLQQLVETLLKCRPHYTRCIKPNGNKRAGVLDETLVRHQIRYLGLVENLRVRRAGYAARQTYERFLRRYKMICNSTWPHWRNDDKSGTETIVKELNISEDEYSFGKTKIFIKDPTTLFALEEKREAALPKVVILMQKVFRGFMVRRRFAKRAAALKILFFYRQARANKFVATIQNVYQGVKNDPKMGKDREFPSAPNGLKGAEGYIKRIYLTWRATKLIKTLGGKDNEDEMRQKVAAYDIFNKKKPWNLQRRFEADYLEQDSNPYKAKYIEKSKQLFAKYGDQQILFADFAHKVNRYNKSQRVGIVVTDRNIYKQDPKNYKVVKFGTPVVNVHSISLSPYKDSLVVVHCKEETGMRDLVLLFGHDNQGRERYSEFVVVVSQLYNQLTNAKLTIKFNETITYNNSRTKAKAGSSNLLTFAPSAGIQNSTFVKGKNGQNQILYSE